MKYLFLLSATFTCTASDWVLDGSKCYKIIYGSPEDCQAHCSNENAGAALMLAPTNIAAINIGAFLSVNACVSCY